MTDTDRELQQLDAAAAKREHTAEFLRHHPEYDRRHEPAEREEPNVHPAFARLLAQHRALPQVAPSMAAAEEHAAAMRFVA